MSNRELEERMEEQGDRKLADKLGITYDELCRLEYHFDRVTGNDGTEYDHYVQFEDDSPQWILNKIDGIDGSNTVYLGINYFDEPDFDEPEDYNQPDIDLDIINSL